MAIANTKIKLISIGENQYEIDAKYLDGIGLEDLMLKNPVNINKSQLDTTTIPFTCVEYKSSPCIVHTVVYNSNIRKQIMYRCNSNTTSVRYYDANLEIPWSEWRDLVVGIKINGVDIKTNGDISGEVYVNSNIPATAQQKVFGMQSVVISDGKIIWADLRKGNSFIGGANLVKLNTKNGAIICDLCLNGQTGGAYTQTEGVQSTTDYKYGIMFSPGVYGLLYKEDSTSEKNKLHFTSFNYINSTGANLKNPYMKVESVTENSTIAYTLTPNTHTVFDLQTPVSFTVSCDGDCSFEFATGSEECTFSFPDTWIWANNVSPNIKPNKKYHISVVNNCAIIVEFGSPQ